MKTLRLSSLRSGIALLLSSLLLGSPVCAQPASTPYVWRNAEIGGGGFVTGIIFHPKEKNLIYARTDIGGAYRWDAGAQRWVGLTDGIGQEEWNFTGIESLAVDPTDPKRVYLAAGTYTNDWAGNAAFFRSDDRGNTWKRTEVPFKMGGNQDGRSNGERLAVDPKAPNILFFGSRNVGLQKSEDYGATWKRVAGFPAVATSPASVVGTGQWVWPIGISFVVFAPSEAKSGKPSPVVYAGVGTRETCLFQSRDAGQTWVPVPGQPVGFRPSHAVFGANGTMYLSYGDEPGPNGVTNGAVWKYDPRSGKWTDVTPVKPSEGDRFGYGGLTVDAQHPETVMVSTIDRWSKKDDLFRSTDGGRTWKALRAKSKRDVSLTPWLDWGRPEAELGWWIGDIEIDPFDANRVLYVTGATIWASKDATAADSERETHWVVGARGLEECVVAEVVSPPNGASVLSVVGDIDGFRHEDLTVSPPSGFFKPGFGSNTAIDFAENRPEIVVRLFHGNNAHGAFSTDNGKTWTPFAGAPAERSGGTVAVSADGTTFVVTPEGTGPLVTSDRGATWTRCAGLPNGIRVIADRANATRFYAFDRTAGTVLTSEDGGKTFQTTTTDLPKGDGYLRAVPGTRGDLWLASGQGLFHAADGKTFGRIDGIEQGHRIGFGKAASGQNYPAIYLVGKIKGTFGFYRSDDRGDHWTRINDDRNQFAFINAITGDPRVFGRVYIASASRGVLYGEPSGK